MDGKGHYSPEIDLLRKIDRFGVMAVMGRPVLYFGEINRMSYAENTVNAYHSRAKSTNWAEWVDDNPVRAAMLAEVEQMLNEGE